MTARALKRMIGLRFAEKNLLRFTWSEMSWGRCGFALDYTTGGLEDRRPHIRLHIGPLSVFLYAPWRHTTGDNFMERPSWGFYYFSKAFVVKYGRKTKHFYMPWDWQHVRHSVLMADGQFKTLDKREMSYDLPGKWQQEFPYRYCLRNFQIQERTAIVGVEEREWRWRWFTWLPFPRKVHRTIKISFNDEVGERTGSWKGGCVGCSYDLREHETPEHALRRMEQERKFN